MKLFKTVLTFAVFPAALTLSAANLFKGDTGAEAGISYLTGGGIKLAPFPASHDLTTAWEGSGSMRFDYDSGKPCQEHTGLRTPELGRGDDYTVSFYAKSDRENFQLGVRLFTVGGWSLKNSYYHTVKIGREWKHHTITFKAKAPKNFAVTAYSLNFFLPPQKNIAKAKIWVDALQLEKGTAATAYAAPQPAAADLMLKSGGPLNIVNRGEPVEAAVRAVNFEKGAKIDFQFTVRDWEGKTVTEDRVPLEKLLVRTYSLPTDRYGWFNVSVKAVSGDQVLAQNMKNYLVLRPPEKIVAGITPFAGVCNQIGYHEELAAANQAIGARYIQIHPIRMGRKYWDMNGKRKFDFSEIDFEFATAEKYGLAVKFCLSPFGWDIRHFTKEEAAEMKKYGVDKHPMLEMRHRELWQDIIRTFLDRYGERIRIFEIGAEDNGRLGVNPYYKAKYPAGIQIDAEGRPWLVSGPAFDAMCTLESDALRMIRKRYPKMKVGAIRPSEGTPNSAWLFVWKQFEKIGKDFNTFPVDTYARLPYYLGPAIDPTKYRGGGPDGRFVTMAHAKRIIAKYGCGQDVYLSETGLAIDTAENGLSPYQREGAEYLARDMIAAKCAGFTSYHVFQGIAYVSYLGYSFAMYEPTGVQMQAASYSAAAQALENVTETRWIKPDSETRVALLKKHDGSGVAAVWSKPGYTMKAPEGIEIYDFMGNAFAPGKDRVLKLSGAPWYFRAPKFQTLENKLSKPEIDQVNYCRVAFRHVTGGRGLIRFENDSNQHPLFLECEIEAGGRKQQEKLEIVPGSWNSISVDLPPGAKKLSVRYRRLRRGPEKYQTFVADIPELTPVRQGTEPVSVMGKVMTAADILPYEPWTPWTGAADLSVVLTGCWNEKELKLRAEVTDDKHFPSARPQSPWQGDSIQVAVDPKNNGAYFRPGQGKRLGDDDVEFALMLGKDGQVSRVVSAGRKDLKMDVKVARNESAGKTVYEMTIPWSELGVKPTKEMVFGLSMVAFDDDSGNGQDYHGLIGGGITHTKHPKLYKKFILKP